jgi:segregation and condensation protein B
MEIENLKSVLESILFISGEPVKLTKLAQIFEVSKAEVENALMVLSGDLVSQKRGLIIVQNNDAAQLVTNPEHSRYIEKIVESELKGKISNAGLEVAAIVAYRGPISRLAIESIRGVNSSYTLRALLMRGLVEREENPNDSRSYLYRISMDFLKKLGLESAKNLPDFEELSQNERMEKIISENDENK